MNSKMPISTRPLKSRRLNFRISDEQEDLLRRGASAKGQSVSEFIIASACSVAECELAEENEFSLPPDRWKLFLEALDKPAAANSALRRLLTEPSVIEEANQKRQ
jgi:uncharacterized protein (DUF1778 family)